MNDDILLCPVCEKEIGFINAELGVFDERYFKNLAKHKCKQWKEIK
tara:strand:- start:3458 stop:3595 length:138 start_codon:yes stop_codon:yes gene_type:complete